MRRDFFSLIGILAIAGSQAYASPPGESTLDDYRAHCAACHGETLAGGPFGPPLIGESFAKKWRGKPLGELTAYIGANMPPSQPGALKSTEYERLSRLIFDRSALGAGVPDAASPMVSDALHVGPNPADPHVFTDKDYEREIARRRQLLDGMTPVSESSLGASPAKNWLSWRGPTAATGFSTLSQIRGANVKQLAVAWAWSLPAGINEIAPLVSDGVMFVQSADELQALDAETGTLLWRYSRNVDAKSSATMTSMHKSIAIFEDNIYMATSDRYVVAVSAKSGTEVWSRQVVSTEEHGVYLSYGPIIARGKVIQGVSGGVECHGGCFVVGLDARTGKPVWRFNTVAAPGDREGNSWNGTPGKQRRGGAVWVPPSYDAGSGLVYFGTGGTYNAASLLVPHPGQSGATNAAALYTDSTIALDPDSGALAWHHQHLARDVWDMDEAFERTLVDLSIGGRKRKLVITIGKLGILDALDRDTGAWVFSRDLGLQTLVSTIDGATGTRTVDPRFEPAADKTVSVCPSPEGVRNWMATAYNPRTQMLYVPMTEACMDYTWRPQTGNLTAEDDRSRLEGVKNFNPDVEPGSVDIGWTTKPRPDSDGNYGRVEAVDLATRKMMWVRRERAPVSSSALATDGGIVFVGYRDRYFRAMDQRSGKTLWASRLNAAPNSSPITYWADGRQFVAVVAGGGAPNDFATSSLTPEIHNSTSSTTLWVFALPAR